MQGLGQSNLNHDFFAYNAANQIWNGSAFVAKVAADFASYRIAGTKVSDVNDPGVEEWFAATAPAGTVRFEMLERGATLADSAIVWTDDIAIDLLQSDDVLEDVGGVRKLKRYRRGTSTELVPAKNAKQPDGSNLTDPTTQRLAGYRE